MFYRIVRSLFWLVALPLFRFRVDGVEWIPEKGAAVLVATHRSWLDPPCVGAACPRPVRFLIKDTVYGKPWARWFYRGMGGIPVSSGGGNPGLSLRAALRFLNDGQLVGVFPEGTVLPQGGLGKLQPGAAMLALRAQVPIIPVEISGSARAWPQDRRLPGPARVRVVIGKPIYPPPQGGGRGALDEMLRRIERALARGAPLPARSVNGPAEPPERTWTPN